MHRFTFAICWLSVSSIIILLASWTAYPRIVDAKDATERSAARVDRACPLEQTGSLQALYDFRELNGDTVSDTAGIGSPIDLQIANPDAVRTDRDGWTIVRSTRLRSTEPATRLIEAIRQTQALTIEVWLRTARKNQSGPARIVSLSQNTSLRNVTFGQDNARFDTRLRTTKTSNNGIPSLASQDHSVGDQRQHVVYTRAADGTARFFIDGRPRGKGQVAGNLSNWDPAYHLTVANESTGDRPWLGTLHRVAIYNRALAPEEIAEHFQAGPAMPLAKPAAASSKRAARTRFREEIAPLLAHHCTECHDAATASGNLDLTHRAAALAGGDRGKLLVPGDAAASLLWQLVESDEMPHDRSPLDDREKQQLRRWIDDGAAWTEASIDPVIYRQSRDAPRFWVRRLTQVEYVNTLRDTLGVDIADAAYRLLPPDPRADGFANTAYNLNVDLKHVEAYAKLAERAVEQLDVVAFATKFHRRRSLTDNDMRKLIQTMGRHILRGPLAEYETATFRGISTTVAAAGGDYEEAVRYVLIAMLQSPRFLYRIERQHGTAPEIPVTPHELASRLSYLTWGGPPDAELNQLADSGQLADCRVVAQQLDRLLDDPKAKRWSEQFAIEWLDLDRLQNLRPNPERFPDWTPELAADMRAETLATFREIAWDNPRPLAQWLDVQVTYLTPRLASHYGIDTAQLSDGFQADDLDHLQRVDTRNLPSRGGLLTHGSVLTIGGDDASMVTRGLFILRDLLFSEVGDPPPGLDTTPIPASPGRSRREIALGRVNSESCGGCHSRIEPLAFGLERYDGLGRFMTTDEHGNRTRADGSILFPGAAEATPYQNTAELTKLLAGNDRVGRALTRKLVQFALGRPLTFHDQDALETIHTRSQERGGTYAAVLKELALSRLILLTPTAATP